MDRKLTAKIIFFFCAASLLSVPARAKEEFVKYTEVQASMAPAKPVAAPGSILPEDLRKLQEKNAHVLIFDARDRQTFDREHIAGARLPRNVDYYHNMELFRQGVIRQAPSSKMALEAEMKDIPRAYEIVTYCNAHCGLSKNLKMDFEDLGFTNVRWLDGGIDVWRQLGYPTEKTSS